MPKIISGTLKVKETLLAVLSDMHVGSSTALFPRNGFVNSQENLVKPNRKQIEIYRVFIRFAGEVATARKGKRLIIVNLGDAVDGFHHGSMQESLFQEKDQCAAHVELMEEFKKRVSFSGDDELYYVTGTETHVGDTENDMAKELGAVKIGARYVSDVLTLDINGFASVFAHHGKARGMGQNEGNALRNFLRDVRSDLSKEGFKQFDALWSGHTHGHTYGTHIARIPGGNFHVMHGIVCPSFQAKTRYAYGKVPLAVNSVGGVYASIGADGTFGVPRFVVQTTKDD